MIGGLAEEVEEKVLHSAFIPFGDITDINIPLDYETGKWRGRLLGKLIIIILVDYQLYSTSGQTSH